MKAGDMVRNRSEKDKERVESIEAMLQRIKEVQVELVRLLEGGIDYKDGGLSPTIEEGSFILKISFCIYKSDRSLIYTGGIGMITLYRAKFSGSNPTQTTKR